MGKISTFNVLFDYEMRRNQNESAATDSLVAPSAVDRIQFNDWEEPVTLQRRQPESNEVERATFYKKKSRYSKPKQWRVYETYNRKKLDPLKKLPFELRDANDNGPKFDGMLEAGQKANYVVFEQSGPGQFRAVPVEEWYHFRRHVAPKGKVFSVEEAEEHIAHMRRNPSESHLVAAPKLSELAKLSDKRARTLDAIDEAMDAEQYEFERELADRRNKLGEKSTNEDALDYDEHFDSDEGDGETGPILDGAAGEEVRTVTNSEMKEHGLAEGDDSEERLGAEGKELKKLLEKAENEEPLTDDAADALSGQKRKRADGDEGGDEDGHEAKRAAVEQRYVPTELSKAALVRCLRERGMMKMKRLLALFRPFLGDEQARAAFSAYVKETVIITKVGDDSFLKLK